MSNKRTEKSVLEQIEYFVYTKQRLVLVIAFLITLFIPISSSRRENIRLLTEQSVNTWVGALKSFYFNIFSTSMNLVVDGIDLTIIFLERTSDFYYRISISDFSILNDSGYFFIAIFITIPIFVIYALVSTVSQIMKKKRDNNSGLNIQDYLSPKKLILILMIIPITEDILWIGTIFTIFLLIYWYLQNIQKERQENPILNIIEIISWKKTILLALAIIMLATSLLASTEEINSLSSLTNLESNAIIQIFIVSLIVVALLWILFQAYITNISILNSTRLIYKEYISIKRVLIYLLGIIFVIPLLDALIIQSPVTNLVYITINIPWVIGLVIYNPIAFLLSLITFSKINFDIIINASREISRGLIPTAPTDISILGIIQPSLWITFLLFIVFLFSFILFLLVYEKANNDKIPMVEILRNYSKYFVFSGILIVVFLIVYIFDGRNFNRIFGNPYEIQTDSFASIFLLGILLTILTVIFAVIVWGTIQLRKGRSGRIILKSILINSSATIISIIMIVPFVWMLKNSFQTNQQNTTDFARQGLIPDPFTTRNYAQIFGLFPPAYETLEYRVVTWLFNTFVAALLVTGFLVIFSAMAGYVLAKRQFIGRKLLFTIIIGIMMVPPYVQVIPLYLELNRLGFVGSLLGIILPFLIQPFSIFLATEFMRSIPDDYLDAARVDGYSEFEIFRKIVLPLSIPVISVLIIINLIANWNSFLWPLLILDQAGQSAPLLRTLPLGIFRINAELQEQMGVVLALATIIVLPLLIILFLAQDYIKKGVTIEGLKG